MVKSQVLTPPTLVQIERLATAGRQLDIRSHPGPDPVDQATVPPAFLLSAKVALQSVIIQRHWSQG